MKQWFMKYEQPAEKWIEALPLGNGHMGAMVFGGCINDRIALNLDTLWSGTGREKGNQGELPDWCQVHEWITSGDFCAAEKYIKDHVLGDYTEASLSVGNLYVSFPGEAGSTVTEYTRSLHLNEGICQSRFVMDGT